MTGAWQMHLRDLGLDRPRVHPLLPVGVVAVDDLQPDRTAERASVPHPGGDLDLVALDLHPPAAPVPELPARHVAVHCVAIQLESCWKSLENAGETRPVRLAGRRHA